jgi:hypothetical protein
MYGDELDPGGAEPSAVNEQEPVIDFDEDQVDIRDGAEEREPPEGVGPDDEAQRIDNAVIDNVLDEFVELVNARDMEGLGELLASDAEAIFLGESSREGLVDGFSDLFLRNPTFLVTRGDLGVDPIVGVWTFDFEADRFDLIGYMVLEMSESDDGLLGRISYIDDVDELTGSDDLVVESPDRSELPEWEDWSELDED